MAGGFHIREDSYVGMGSQFFHPIANAALPQFSQKFGREWAENAPSDIDILQTMDFWDLTPEQFMFAYGELERVVLGFGWANIWQEMEEQFKQDPRFITA